MLLPVQNTHSKPSPLGWLRVGIVLFLTLHEAASLDAAFVLGLCFAWGALIGWAGGIRGRLALAPLLLYAAAITWTIGFDTIYAIQDIGGLTRSSVIKSACALFSARGENEARRLPASMRLERGPWWRVPSRSSRMLGLIGYLCRRPPRAEHLAWQVRHMESRGKKRARALLKAVSLQNRDAGLIPVCRFSLAALLG